MTDKERPKDPKPYTRYRSSRIRSRLGRQPRLGRDERGGGRRARPPVEETCPAPVQPVRPEKPRRRRWGRGIGLALLSLLLLLLLAAGVSYWLLDRAVRESNSRVPADVPPALTAAGSISSQPVNILFMGSDQRPGEPARADTLMLMRVDRQAGTISQLSIPRDTLADIPGYGEGKINSAYAYGGPALQIEAVQQLTGLPVHHYVELDFDGFPAIVDSLGGVDIDVPKTIDSQYPEGVQWTQVHFDAGPQHMDGERALTYVRVRYSDDDFQRMGRQQQFMQALTQKLTSPVNLLKMPAIGPRIMDNMTTDISTNDLIRLAWAKFRTPEERSRSYTLAGYGQYIGGVSYVVLDEEASRQVIRQFLGN